MSIAAQRRYINFRTDKVLVNVLLQDSDALPKRLKTWQDFKKVFDNKTNYEFTFCGFTVVVNTRYAYKHFFENTYFEQRGNINGTLYSLLHDPLILVKDSKTLTFYKPFRNKNNILHMMSFQAHQTGNDKYLFKTIYEVKDNISKVKKVIKATDQNTVFFKYS